MFDISSLNLEALNLNRKFSFEEFEAINEWQRTKDVRLDEESAKLYSHDINEPILLFEFDSTGMLIPIPMVTLKMSVIISEIMRQLANWNIETRQNGKVTGTGGGFNFSCSGGKEIRTPNAAFLTKEMFRSLTHEQLYTFRGAPFHPSFLVEVKNVSRPTKLNELTTKFKNIYLPAGVKLGWLIDPENKVIYRTR